MKESQAHSECVHKVLNELNLIGLQSGAIDDGSTLLATQGPELESYDPTTGNCIGRIRTASRNEYEVIMDRLQKRFLSWREVPAPVRAEVMSAIGLRLKENISLLAYLMAIEMGKTVREAKGEIIEAIHMCEQVARLARQLGGEPIQSERRKHFMWEQYHPCGIVGCMTAWNFPTAVLFWNWALALVCGNVGLWKPSSVTPLTSIALQRIINEVCTEHGHPGIMTLVIGSGDTVGKWMLEDERLFLVSFTGSSETGRVAKKMLADRLESKPPILECGGNNAITVTPHADMDKVLRGAYFGAIALAGQRCTTTRRLIVHESRYEELKKRLLYAYSQTRIGDPLEENTLMGPLINKKAVRDMNIRMRLARERDDGILLYGSIPTDKDPESNFVVPAIIRMSEQTPSMRVETFAPILYIVTYNGSLEEAIAINNDVPQGLSSSIFTENLAEAMRFISAMGSDCGIANVNCAPSGAEIGGAFGGEKETGGGREAGSDCWKQYMRRQTNTIFWGKAEEMTLAQGIKFEVE